MTDDVVRYLRRYGPARSRRIAQSFIDQGVKPEAARQRLSRAHQRGLILRFPIPILPRRESFFYLQAQRTTEQFWTHILRDMRETHSVQGMAIDGITARGGFVTQADFAVVGAAYAYPQAGQLMTNALARSLLAAGFIHDKTSGQAGPGYILDTGFGLALSENAMRARRLTEAIILDGMREWARNVGLTGYNSIAIRGEPGNKPVGPFSYDLWGASWLLPLYRGERKFGFFVADVFADREITLHDLQYFIRKARISRSALPDAGVVAMIVAERFTPEALTAGHAAGVLLATPAHLFGRRVGTALLSLVETLKNAAAYASSSPERLTRLLDDLSEIEGRAKNLRGILFELMAAYLARLTAVSIDMGVIARDENGRTADMDVVAFTHQRSAITVIECKAKEPGGILSLAEVETWLAKLPIMRAHYNNDPYYREAALKFELWTTGTIAPDALERLQREQQRRTRTPLNWKSGQEVLQLAREGREKAITDALYQHFIGHPLTEVASNAQAEAPQGDLSPFLWAPPVSRPSKRIVPEDMRMLPPPRKRTADDFDDGEV